MENIKFAYQIPRDRIPGFNTNPEAGTHLIFSKNEKILISGNLQKITVFFSVSPDAVENLKKNIKNLHSRRETAFLIKQALKETASFRKGVDPDDAISRAFKEIHDRETSPLAKRKSEKAMPKFRERNVADEAKTKEAKAIISKKLDMASDLADLAITHAETKLEKLTSSIGITLPVFEAMFKDPLMKNKILRVDETKTVYTTESALSNSKKSVELKQETQSDVIRNPEKTLDGSPIGSNAMLSQTQKNKPLPKTPDKNLPDPSLTVGLPRSARSLGGAPKLPGLLRQTAIAPNAPGSTVNNDNKE